MILRPVRSSRPAPQAAEARPAYQVFVAHQEQVRGPSLSIPQSSHAHLSGALAEALLPEVFGPLPGEVVEAIRQHDYGWIGSDLEQARGGMEILPFPQLAAEEAVPAWEATVRLAETVSPLVGVLVNRHFCLLSDDNDNSLHRQFRKRAAARRIRAESSLRAAAGDLDRWTAALGVCDLLSLYLCSGCADPVEFPLCHPADKAARERAEKTVLRWEDGAARWTRPLLRPGTRVAQDIPAVRDGEEAVRLEWTLA